MRLPRIAEMAPGSGFAMESLISSIAQADPEAKGRLKEFLEKRGPEGDALLRPAGRTGYCCPGQQ